MDVQILYSLYAEVQTKDYIQQVQRGLDRDHVPNMSHMNFYNMIRNQKSMVRCGMSVAWQREVCMENQKTAVDESITESDVICGPSCGIGSRIAYGVYGVRDKKAERIRIPQKYNGHFVINIRPGAFRSNNRIMEVILNKNISEIPEECFAGCTHLERVVIPRKLYEIEEGAFRGCVSLKEIYFGGTYDEWKAIKIKEFIRCVETSGRCQPGRPVEDVTKDVLIPVTGNEALRRATIYFRYNME